MRAMSNQWKVSSNYVTTRLPPMDTPFEFCAGSTARLMRRSFLAETAIPYVPGAVSKCTWPPPLPANLGYRTQFQVVTPPVYGGAHLKRYTITAGLGGIDPKRG